MAKSTEGKVKLRNMETGEFLWVWEVHRHVFGNGYEDVADEPKKAEKKKTSKKGSKK